MNCDHYAYGQMFPNYTSDMSTPLIMSMEPTPVQFESIFVIPDNRVNAFLLIQQATTMEAEDSMLYAFLIELAPTEEERQIIFGIRADEIRHLSLFNQIYIELSGKRLPEPTTSDQFIPPQTYCEGLKRAIFGEQNAIIYYRQILYSLETRTYINIVAEIMTDEIRHGYLYNYLYAKNGCTV